MLRTLLVYAVLLSLAVILATSSPAPAQERVTPKGAKGGVKQGEPWAAVPESFQYLKNIPQWPLPTDLKRWQEVDRAKVRATLLDCLGDMPPRPDPRMVSVVSKEDHGDYTLERFEFHNGVDMRVPGILFVPKNRQGPVPAIIALHGHGSVARSGKVTIETDPTSELPVGPMLARKGYVVAAIDGYFHGERLGKGPGGEREDKNAQEATLFKLFLWQGRTLWGMMLREEQCLIDYLQTRPEVDRERIGATGMSMGCTRSWWLAALDERIKAIVGVCCFTRYTELIAHGNIRAHGIFYFVPGVLKHFDTEAIYALVAPRPMLMLSGDQDGGAPTDGVITLEQKLGAVYRLHGKPDHFRSVIYQDTGHEYLPEMKEEMVRWFERHLPVVKAGQAFIEDTRSIADEDPLNNSIGMKLAKIPAGKFTMGSPPDESGRDDDEEQHPVEIARAFQLGKHEVTVGQFRAFVRDTGYVTEPERDGVGGSGYSEQAGTWKFEGRQPQFTWRTTGLIQSDEHPVANVTWNDAVAFCEWVSQKEGRTYRLPTEAEWEYSCRAHTKTRYYSRDDEDSLGRVANLADAAGKPKFPHWKATVSHDDGHASTAPVGSFKANAFGLHDMHGNLWEWCADWYDAGYYRTSPRHDPQGPAAGTLRVARGGCWNEAARTARAADRSKGVPSYRSTGVGFRVLLEL